MATTDQAIDRIYETIDEMLRNSEFAKVDALLYWTPVADTKTAILLAYLTITFPARNKLPSRARFFEDTKTTIKSRGQWRNGILDGLGQFDDYECRCTSITCENCRERSN